MVKIKQFLVVISSVVKTKQFLVVISSVVKMKQFLVVISTVVKVKQFLVVISKVLKIKQVLVVISSVVRASSYQPGRPGWLGFRHFASPLFSLQKFRCIHMRRRAGPVTEISVTELEIFPISTLHSGYREETFSTAHGL